MKSQLKAAFLLLMLQDTLSLTSCFITSTSTSPAATTTPPSVVALMAKKPNKKNKKDKGRGNTASSKKGFGAAPPTLEEITSSFKTKLSDNADTLPCPCGVHDGGVVLDYAHCCAPYHKGEKVPETPLRVLQTRYSAFCYRLVAYIIQTTHPNCRDYRENQQLWAQDLNRNGMFDSFDFIQLIPGPEEYPDDKPNAAYIDFKVRMRAKQGEQQETIVSEKSLFLKNPDTDGWLYASGEVRSDVAGLEDAILNQ